MENDTVRDVMSLDSLEGMMNATTLPPDEQAFLKQILEMHRNSKTNATIYIIVVLSCYATGLVFLFAKYLRQDRFHGQYNVMYRDHLRKERQAMEKKCQRSQKRRDQKRENVCQGSESGVLNDASPSCVGQKTESVRVDIEADPCQGRNGEVTQVEDLDGDEGSPEECSSLSKSVAFVVEAQTYV